MVRKGGKEERVISRSDLGTRIEMQDDTKIVNEEFE